MTSIKTTNAPIQPLVCPEHKAFYLSAAFSVPARGKRLTLAFNVAVTLRDPVSG